MPIQVTIHPAARAGLRLVSTALAAAISLGFVLRSLSSKTQELEPEIGSVVSVAEPYPEIDVATLLGTLDLCVREAAHEAEWVSAAATRLAGHPEFSISNGRVDVVTDRFAIEIDWAAKWHEGIGQSLHYADATGLRAALGLIVDGGESALRHVRAADDVASSRGIKVFILRRRCAK